MNQELYYFIFNTSAGYLGILASAKGLLRTTLPHHSDKEVRQLLGGSNNQAKWSPEMFQELMQRFQAYFSGDKVTFPDQLDLTMATAFQREVWEIARLIPYGETRSYKWLAEQIKKPRAWRAVGQALGKNPLPIIIPCHRVLASKGSLGGFSGGLEMKKYLLAREMPGDIR